MKRPSSYQILGIAILTLTLGLLLGCSDTGGSADRRLREAPEFSLSTLDGSPVRLSDYRGKVVLLHFWATWCPPCTAAMPHEKELQEKYGEEGFVVLGMNMDRELEDVEAFLRENPVNYPVVLVDEGTRKAYGGVSTLPLTVLVDRDGTIRKKKMGFVPEDVAALERKIEQLLEEEG